jgi:uncharacterized protein (DUF2342 family)
VGAGEHRGAAGVARTGRREDRRRDRAAQRDAVPEQAQAGVAQMLGQVSPLLLGAQVGTVLGTLAQQVLGQYDIAVPRPDGAGALLFVVPNIARFERSGAWTRSTSEPGSRSTR